MTITAKIRYRIALCSVFWSENDINNRYFDSVESQTTYFNVLTEGKFSPLVNFNMGNSIQTKICYKDTSNRSIEELLACNYAVVEKLNDNEEVIVRRFFFAYPEQDSGTQLFVTLSLDHIQTNFIRYQNQIAPCMIRRAHLDRWVDNGDDTYSFNLSDNSPLFEREMGEENPQRLVKRQKLNFAFTENNDVDNWLNTHVAYWVYVFIDGTKQYSVAPQTTIGGGSFKLITCGKNTGEVRQDYGVFCYPVYKKGVSGSMFTNINNVNMPFNDESENAFRAGNDNSSYYFSRKISLIPPFYDTNSKISVSGNNLIIEPISSTQLSLNDSQGNRQVSWVQCRDSSSDRNLCLFIGMNQRKFDFYSVVEETSIKTKFSKIEINDNKQCNPKMLSTDNITLKLRSFDGKEFDYDLQKYGTNEFTFIYSETIQPEVTKYYFRLAPHGLYEDGVQNNYFGLVGSTDTTIAVTNDQYANFLANNKNFWLQTALKIGTTEGVGLLSNFIKGDLGGAISNIIGGVSTYVNSGLTLDNMKNAPDTISNASGNVLFNMQIDELGLYYEIYEGIEINLQSSNDYNKQFGYAYNRIDYLTNCINIREMYNYVEADINIINAPINNVEKQALRELFKGIRFWNTDTNVGDYTLLNNKERSLNNG